MGKCNHSHGKPDKWTKPGDIAGQLTFVASLGTLNAGLDLPRWGKAVVQCGATLFGATCSIANLRTCRNSMLEYKNHVEETDAEQRSILVN